MINGSFIERHGLVRYTGRLGRTYPRDGECEAGACRLIRQQDAEHRAETRAQLGRVLAGLAALDGHKTALLAEQPADDDARRARRRGLDRARLRKVELSAVRGQLDRVIDLHDIAEFWDEQHAARLARSLVFDHCHLHGWVRGLVCPDCNGLLGVADAGRLTANSAPWAPGILAYRLNCPDCRALGDETGKP